MRELRLGKIAGNFYLFPVPVMKERKYLIHCSSEVEGKLISDLVQSGRATHPDLISEDFIFLTYHTDKQTRIYVPNPKLLKPVP